MTMTNLDPGQVLKSALNSDGDALRVDLSATGENDTPLIVDGSGVTQPVSAASLPLPSGAATAAKQPALGTAGTPSADVITVQGHASGTALPVSGSVTTLATQGSFTDRSGTTSGSGGTSTEVMAANASRKYLFIQNLDATTAIYINFGTAAAVDTAGSIKLGSGIAYCMEGACVSTQAMNVASSGTSIKYTAKEM